MEVTCRYNQDFELSKGQLEALLRPLTGIERLVVSYRFGFIDGRAHTLQETGDLIGLSRERVRHVEARAMHKARPASR